MSCLKLILFKSSFIYINFSLQKYEDEKTWNEEKILNAKIYIYDNLANAAMVQQNYDNAEKLFKEVMRGLLQKGISSTDNSVIEISLKLAMMFAVREMVDEAEKGYEYCIRSQEEKLQNETNPDDNTLALFGLALDSYARFLTLQKRYKEARKFLQRALDTAVRVLGADSPQVGVLHSDIATLDLLQGDDDSALANLNTAIQLAKKSNSPDLAAFYVNLGNVYLNKSNLKSANDSCQAALALAQKLNMLSVIEEAKACLKTVKEYKKT